MSLHILVIVLALVSFVIGAFGIIPNSRVNWELLGFSFLTSSLLV